MLNLLFSKNKEKKLFHILKFLFIIILGSCQNTPRPLSSALSEVEKKNVEILFNYLFFDNPGIYVLYGSKPMSDSPLPPELNLTREEIAKLIDSLPEELRKNADVIECDYNKQWALWEKIQDRFNITKFILAKRICENAESIYIVDVEKTISILSHNYNLFKSVAGTDFSPSEKVHEIKNPDSLFWGKILQDDFAMGLLYGFGEENVRLFNEKASNVEKVFSTQDRIKVGTANPSRFTIPRFATIEGDETVRKYEVERKEIGTLYSGKDMLETTLRQLSKQ